MCSLCYSAYGHIEVNYCPIHLFMKKVSKYCILYKCKQLFYITISTQKFNFLWYSNGILQFALYLIVDIYNISEMSLFYTIKWALSYFKIIVCKVIKQMLYLRICYNNMCFIVNI